MAPFLPELPSVVERSRSKESAPGSSVSIGFGLGPTPIGFVFVATTARGIRAVSFLDSDDPSPALARLRVADVRADATIADVWIPRIVAFLNEGRTGAGLKLDLRGKPFQVRVWKALRTIPRGETTTYGALARTLGLPDGAARAVGSACGANPIAILVPCHRVVRAGGGLGGYHWGLDRKRALLALEGASVPVGRQFARPRYSPVRVSTRTVTP